MLNTDIIVSTATRIPFVGFNNDTGLTTFDLMILKDGRLYTGLTAAPTYSEIGEGLYTMNVTFTETGIYTIYVENAIVAHINVRDRSLLSYLINIEDEALGSWQWNKQTNALTLSRINGQALGTFQLTDTDTLSARERV